QAAKLLADVSVPAFYPALFSLVAGLLEAFGNMVFERIRARAEDPEDGGEAQTTRHSLRRGWTCDDVGAEARETCRNWFYKTACIRELLPRILIEVQAV
ncbi:unnamed protein product, partial [Laminaria digitata]